MLSNGFTLNGDTSFYALEFLLEILVWSVTASRVQRITNDSFPEWNGTNYTRKALGRWARFDYFLSLWVLRNTEGNFSKEERRKKIDVETAAWLKKTLVVFLCTPSLGICLSKPTRRVYRVDGQREFAFFCIVTRIEQYAITWSEVFSLERWFSRLKRQSVYLSFRTLPFGEKWEQNKRSHINFYLLICLCSMMKHKFSSKVEHFSSSRSYENDAVRCEAIKFLATLANETYLQLIQYLAFARRLLPNRNFFLLQPSYAQQQTCASWPC